MKNDEELPNEFGLTETVVSDDFFEGLEELTGSATDPFTAISSNIDRWPLANNSATAAGGSWVMLFIAENRNFFFPLEGRGTGWCILEES